ncbi:MAG TPA: thioredoxin family protein [Gemmatimonadaceae bacterium]|nr:thioredoxin family protein [Gemmatimonadaceae bacterium]
MDDAANTGIPEPAVIPAVAERFKKGETFPDFLKRSKDNGELWDALYKRAVLSPDLSDRAGAIEQPWHLLVLNEAWCGDSVNLLPHVARLEEASPNIELRIIGRDANPDIMNAHLTRTSRSIPIVIVLDEAFVERGWWGPRPDDLQRWVYEEGLALPKPDRYRHMRTWYARDRGRSVVSEILTIIERAEGRDEAAAG